MQIICDTTFLDGRDRFEKGDQRTPAATDTETSEQRAQRFIAAGWAHAAGTDPAPNAEAGPVSLDIDNATHGQEVRHG